MLGLRSSGSRPAPSGGTGLGLAERRVEEDEQRREERAEAEQHARRVGDDVAQAVARDEDRDARPDREQPDPQQQRALLRGPHRRDAVEQRRRRARRVRDRVVGEVVADEGDLEDHHRERQDRRRGSRPSAGRSRPSRGGRGARRRARRRCRRGVRRAPPPARGGRRTPSVPAVAQAEPFGAAEYFDGHFVIIESGLGVEGAVVERGR